MSKSLITFLAIPILLFGLSRNIHGEDIEINKSLYSISKNEIIQKKSSFLDDGSIKIGAVSDIEGEIKRASESAAKLKEQNVDMVIIAGDNYENEKIRRNSIYPNSTNNLEEMIGGIRPYAQLGVPVFIIPGNHEEKSIYNQAVKILQKNFPNVFEINDVSVDLKGLNLVGLGGYYSPSFTSPQGFLLHSEDYQNALKKLRNFLSQKEPIFFVTHSPPKSKTKMDYVAGAGNVGDEALAGILNQGDLSDIINLCGHIHEGGGNIARFNSGISINVAAISSYNNPRNPNTGMITIKDNKLSYSELK